MRSRLPSRIAYGRQQHRDSDDFSYVTSVVYQPGAGLDQMLEMAREADVVVKHSGIGVDDETLERRVLELQESAAITYWDVDAPATIARMHGDPNDAFRAWMPRYDAVLTYGGGPFCRDEFTRFGARAYFSMYNGLDPETHCPVAPDPELKCDVGLPRKPPAGSRGAGRGAFSAGSSARPGVPVFTWRRRVGR